MNHQNNIYTPITRGGLEDFMPKSLWKKGLVVGIILLFVGTSFDSVSNAEIKNFDIKSNDITYIRNNEKTYFGSPPEEWNKTFGGLKSDDGYSVKQTSDGGFIIAGLKDSWMDENMTDYGEGWLIKTDNNGNIQWDRIFEGRGRRYFTSIGLTSDGGYIMTGITNEYNEMGDADIWLVKTDNSGNEQWNKSFGSNYLRDFGYGVQQTTDGGYIITGWIDNFVDNNNGSLCLIKTDNNGNMQWNKKFTGVWSARGQSVQQTSDNGYIITGFVDTAQGYEDIWLIKTDSNGNEQWNKTYGGTNYNFGFSVQQTAEGGYIVAGIYNVHSVNSTYYGNLWLIKTDNNGNMQWNKIYDETNFYWGVFVQQALDGGYIITGSIPSNSNGNSDVWLIKTDNNGNMQWDKTFGGINNDGGKCVQQTHDGGYIITGYASSFSTGSYDVWLIKVKSENQPPEPPTITGLTSIKPKISYIWNFTTIDPNNDEVFYQINWGDNNITDWLGPYHSGTSDSESHFYKNKGTYTIKAKAKDVYGNESEWATLAITVPYSYNIPFLSFLERFFERFPNAFPILRHMLGY